MLLVSVFLVDKYSVVTILCNYLQLNKQPYFWEKNIFKYLCKNCLEISI